MIIDHRSSSGNKLRCVDSKEFDFPNSLSLRSSFLNWILISSCQLQLLELAKDLRHLLDFVPEIRQFSLLCD